MNTPFRFEYDGTHRFLRTAEVALQADGVDVTVDTAASASGRRVFAFPDHSTTLVLKVSVKGSAPHTKPLLRVEQTFRRADKSSLFTPETWVSTRTAGASPRAREGLDPRLSRFHAAMAKGSTMRVALDAPFLDVSDGVLNQAWPPPKGQQTARPTMQVAYDSAAPGAQLLMFEYTRGHPRAWLVVVPPALTPRRTEIGALLFFRPTGDPYSVPEDQKLFEYFHDRVLRYLVADSSKGPFFVVPRKKDLKLEIDPYGQFGFANQLVASGRPAVLIYPVPHGGSFQDAKDEKGLELVAKLIRTLWAEGYISTELDSGVSLGTLGIAGFSHGGEALLSTLKANVSAVAHKKPDGPAVKPIDELYAFDPNTFTANRAVLERWFKSTPGKRLRMLAGAFENATMFAMAKSLGDPNNATVQPTSDAFWRDDPLYQASLQAPSAPGLFSAAGSSDPVPTGSLTARTNIFFVSHDAKGVRLEARWTVAGKEHKVTRLVPGYSHAEAAAVVHFESLRDRPQRYPVESEATFSQVVAELLAVDENHETIARRVRHEWPGIGGEDSAGATDRGKTFKGHLQLALERSGF